MKVLQEIKGLYKIIEFITFRRTPNVLFDLIPMELFSHISAMDRVIHDKNAVSPGQVGDVERPWYMHHHQDDNLIVFSGKRYVELYNKEHGKIEKFIVTRDEIYHNNELVASGSVMLVWPRNVFHRIISGDDGSASLNVAVHYEGFDIKNNFDIYALDVKTGEYMVIRKGFEDQID